MPVRIFACSALLSLFMTRTTNRFRKSTACMMFANVSSSSDAKGFRCA